MEKMKLGIGARLYLSFAAVIFLFCSVCGYQFYSISRLGELQDEGAQRGRDSIAILDIAERAAASYSVIGDALINRQLAETRESFQALKTQAEKDVKTVAELVDTAEERALADEFGRKYMQYLATFEEQMLPILAKEESLIQRANDALAISQAMQHLESAYAIMADGIINRELEQTRRELDAFRATAQADMATVHGLVDTAEEKDWAKQFAEKYQAYLDLYSKRVLPLLKRGNGNTNRLRQLDAQLDGLRNAALDRLTLIEKSLNQELEEIESDERQLRKLDGVVDELEKAALTPLHKIVDALNEETLEADSYFDGVSDRTRAIAITVSIFATLLGFGISYWITRFLLTQLGAEPTYVAEIAERIAVGDMGFALETKKVESGVFAAMKKMVASLREKAELATTIAGGDLSKEVYLASDKDTLGKALQEMSANLNSLLNEVQVAGEQIAAGSSQVSDSSQSLSQGATESASSLEEISASMTEMASQTKLNAENAGVANNLSGEAKKAAENGNRQMQEMVAAMAEINEAGQNISKIIKVIDEIAFQTNLLALNAAVEAARAGQHGKGFAVVAEEVRNLAARSAKAAHETAELIEGSVSKTENGAQIAEQTAESLGEIVTGITKVTDLVNEIAAASNEQAEGIGQVNQGLTQVDQVTQQNTANAEESAAAAEELSSQAAQLREMLQRFKLKSDGRQQQKFAKPKLVITQTAGRGGNTDASQSQKMIALDDQKFGTH